MAQSELHTPADASALRNRVCCRIDARISTAAHPIKLYQR